MAGTKDGANGVRVTAEKQPYGVPVANATAWQCQRAEGAQWAACLWYDAGTGIACKSWPLSELSVKTIGERWGSGRYRLIWIGPTNRVRLKGKRLALGTSPHFTLDGYAAKSTYPNAPAAPAAPAPADVDAMQALRKVDTADPVALFTCIYGLVSAENRRVLDAQSAGMQQMMLFLATAHESEKGRLREHYEALAKLNSAPREDYAVLAREVRALASHVAELRREDDEEEEEEEEPAALGAKPDVLADLLEGVGRIVKDVGPGAVRAGLKKLGVLDDDDE